MGRSVSATLREGSAQINAAWENQLWRWNQKSRLKKKRSRVRGVWLRIRCSLFSAGQLSEAIFIASRCDTFCLVCLAILTRVFATCSNQHCLIDFGFSIFNLLLFLKNNEYHHIFSFRSFLGWKIVPIVYIQNPEGNTYFELRAVIRNTSHKSGKICLKKLDFDVFIYLKRSQVFLSMIFGFLGKFRIDIGTNPHTNKKNQHQKTISKK